MCDVEYAVDDGNVCCYLSKNEKKIMCSVIQSGRGVEIACGNYDSNRITAISTRTVKTLIIN